jgi:hypothetical protein
MLLNRRILQKSIVEGKTRSKLGENPRVWINKHTQKWLGSLLPHDAQQPIVERVNNTKKAISLKVEIERGRVRLNE